MNGHPLPETCCRGTLWIWPGHAAYLGPSLHLDTHSGSVHCFALGVDAPFTLQDERRARSAYIPARTRHRIIADPGRMLFFYVDPTSTTDIKERMKDQTPTIAYNHQNESTVIKHITETKSPDLTFLRQEIFGALAPTGIDERIRTAMLILRAQLNLSAAELAAEANLSTSRFLHLFATNAGTSFRRYRLWARMLHVAVATSKGLDLTRAATEAGFASPSHFSDTFHNMFGLTAKALLTSQTRIIVH